MLRVGIAGIGFMGWIHWLAYQNVRGAKVAAISTRNEKKRAGDWRGIQGNFGPPGTQVDLSGVNAFATIDEMLADPKIDMIDNCLPPDMHVDVSLKALKAGKHVLVEKPMALTAAECRRLVRAATIAKRQIMVAHVLPFFPEYAQARKIINSGKYGKLIGGHFKRVISDPSWLKDFYNPARLGGPLIDLHVHDAHLIRMLFGMPTGVSSVGRMRGKVVEYASTVFKFQNPKLAVSAVSGVINQQGRPFTHGFEIHLEKATLHHEMAVVGGKVEVMMPLTLLDSKGKATQPKLTGAGDTAAFEAEIKEAATAIRTGKPSSILSGDLARDAIILCHKQTESVVKGRPVKV